MPRDCPDCQGDGYFIVYEGATFDERQEQWYPNERHIPCDRCGGEGKI